MISAPVSEEGNAKFSSLPAEEEEFVSATNEQEDVSEPRHTAADAEKQIKPAAPARRPEVLAMAGSVEGMNNYVEEKRKNSEPYGLSPISVVEDPDTPMSRVTSPAVASPERSRLLFSPPLVQEEKSPNVRAQEALAKLQSLTVTSLEKDAEAAASAPTETSSMTKDKEETRTLTENHRFAMKTEHANSAGVEVEAVVSEETSTKRPFAELSQELYRIQSLERERGEMKAEPMPLSQLYALYHNHELTRNGAFVNEFVQVKFRNPASVASQILQIKERPL